MRCGCLVCVLYVEPEGGRVVTGGGVGWGGLDRCTLSGFWVVCSTASNKRTVQLKVKLDSATSRRCLSSLYAAQCGDLCLCVRVDVCREKLKYGNAVFTKQQGGRFTALCHAIVWDLSHSGGYLVFAPHTRLPIWGDLGPPGCELLSGVIWWGGVFVRACVCVFCEGGGGSLNTSGAQGFVGGVCLFSVSCSFNLISLHSFSFFVRIISSSLSLPPSACCDL